MHLESRKKAGMSKDKSLARVRRLYDSAQPERDKRIQLLAGGFKYVICIYMWVKHGKTIINHPFGNGSYHLIIYGDLGDGLFLFYPHSVSNRYGFFPK